MTSVSNFVKNNLALCVCTLGLAIVGYLGYRAVIWVTEKWRNAGRVNEAAQEALRAERAPLDGREEADEPNPLVGRVATGPAPPPETPPAASREVFIMLQNTEDVLTFRQPQNQPPITVRLTGSLYLRNRRHPIVLPANLVIEHDINVEICDVPIQFPLSLRVNGDMRIYHCPRITELSHNLIVGGSLCLWDCLELRQLPRNLTVGGNLDIARWGFTSLPTNLRVPGNLRIHNCTQLTSLPRGLSVGGNLDISFCPNLTTLPTALRVPGNLIMSWCYSLTALPADLHVGGHINLTACTGLTDLPDWITELGYVEGTQEIRNIDLTGTGLPEAVIARLRQVRNPCIRIYFSIDEHPRMLAGSNPGPTVVPTLPERPRMVAGLNPGLAVDSTVSDLTRTIDFWHRIAVTREPSLPLPELSLSHGASDVYNFLHRLQETREYQTAERRPFLAVRILEVINRMARDVDFCEVTVAEMAAAVVSCGDRVILALDNLDVAYRVRRIEDPLGSEEALRALGRSLLLLAKVDEQAAIKMRTLTFVDEIEVQLAYRLTLARALELPISTRTMLYRGCAGVSDPEIRDAGAIVLRACTPAAINQFLAEWEPWKKHLRRTEVTAYDSLPVSGAVFPQGAVCPFTLERPEQAIWYSGNVYEYASFVREFIRTGLDPTNRQPIVWAQVTRFEAEAT